MIKVSVCMATYNGAKYIKEQMDSILHQNFVKNTDVEMEIIVSDDMSKDDTILILENYRDSRIKIFHHTERKLKKHYTALCAATANFANAMSKATGDYIFLADQDDVWYPNKIDDTLEVLKEKGGVVAADFDFMSENGEITGHLTYKPEPLKKFLTGYMPYGFSIGISSQELKYILPMPEVYQHDWFICLSALIRQKLHYVHANTAGHRWIGNENTSISASKEPLLYKMLGRLKMYCVVFVRLFK